MHTHYKYGAERTRYCGESGPGRIWVIYVNHHFHRSNQSFRLFVAIFGLGVGRYMSSTLQLTASRWVVMRGRNVEKGQSRRISEIKIAEF